MPALNARFYGEQRVAAIGDDGRRVELGRLGATWLGRVSTSAFNDAQLTEVGL